MGFIDSVQNIDFVGVQSTQLNKFKRSWNRLQVESILGIDSDSSGTIEDGVIQSSRLGIGLILTFV